MELIKLPPPRKMVLNVFPEKCPNSIVQCYYFFSRKQLHIAAECLAMLAVLL